MMLIEKLRDGKLMMDQEATQVAHRHLLRILESQDGSKRNEGDMIMGHDH